MVSKSEISVIFKDAMDEPTSSQPAQSKAATAPKVPCSFCGQLFKGDKGVKIHEKKCPEK